MFRWVIFNIRPQVPLFQISRSQLIHKSIHRSSSSTISSHSHFLTHPNDWSLYKQTGPFSKHSRSTSLFLLPCGSLVESLPFAIFLRKLSERLAATALCEKALGGEQGNSPHGTGVAWSSHQPPAAQRDTLSRWKGIGEVWAGGTHPQWLPRLIPADLQAQLQINAAPRGNKKSQWPWISTRKAADECMTLKDGRNSETVIHLETNKDRALFH